MTGTVCAAGGAVTTGTGTGAASDAARAGAGAAFSITVWGVADSGVLCCAAGVGVADGSTGTVATSGAGNSSWVAARPKRWAVMLPGLRANSPLADAVVAGSEGKRLVAISLRNTCTTIRSATVCSGQYRLAINSRPICAAITASPTPGWARSCGGGAINRDLVTRSMFPQLCVQAEQTDPPGCKKLIWKLTFQTKLPVLTCCRLSRAFKNPGESLFSASNKPPDQEGRA